MADVAQNLFLIGMPGSGKSTVGRALARRLGFIFHDADDELIRRTGVSIATIFEVEGEVGFRQREAQVVADLVGLRGIVLATGGGAILRADTRAQLKRNGEVIYLRASIEELVKRTQRDRNRPLLHGALLQGAARQTVTPEQKLRELMAIRDPLYREIADLTVESTPRGAGRLAFEIIEKLAIHAAQSRNNAANAQLPKAPQ